MVVCGIEMKGSDSIVVLMSGTLSSPEFIKNNVKKFSLQDDGNASSIKAFQKAIFTFFRENDVMRIGIKKRTGGGLYAGGGVGFKMEALVQGYDQAEVALVNPGKIASTNSLASIHMPKSLPRYQESSFRIAFSQLDAQ